MVKVTEQDIKRKTVVKENGNIVIHLSDADLEKSMSLKDFKESYPSVYEIINEIKYCENDVLKI